MKQGEEEQKLVKLAVKGNIQAFGELFERHKEYFYKMAYLHSGNEEDALDIVQESILKGYRGVKSLKKSEYFSTWMTRIIINTARDTLRKRRPQLELDKADASAEEQAGDLDRNMDVRAAVENLPEKYRTVIFLRYFQDLPVLEIAEKLGVPPSTVSTNLHRGRLLLEQELRTTYGKERALCQRD